MRLAWATDIHLEFATAATFDAFCAAIEATRAEALLLGGDIATAPGLERWLSDLDSRLGCPIYFVLGNHDYYHGGIASVRATAARAAAKSDRLVWLCETGAIALTPATALVGSGGWGDARLGNPETPVRLNDFVLIEDLVGLPREVLHARLRALGDEAARHLRGSLAEALAGKAREIVVLTHVPPFREACWHEGRLSNGDWLPYFACKAVGDVLLEAARADPDRHFTVLCGHTHSAGEADPRPNLHVSTGGAQYGLPSLQRVLEVPATSVRPTSSTR